MIPKGSKFSFQFDHDLLSCTSVYRTTALLLYSIRSRLNTNIKPQMQESHALVWLSKVTENTLNDRNVCRSFKWDEGFFTHRDVWDEQTRLHKRRQLFSLFKEKWTHTRHMSQIIDLLTWKATGMFLIYFNLDNVARVWDLITMLIPIFIAIKTNFVLLLFDDDDNLW